MRLTCSPVPFIIALETMKLFTTTFGCLPDPLRVSSRMRRFLPLRSIATYLPVSKANRWKCPVETTVTRSIRKSWNVGGQHRDGRLGTAILEAQDKLLLNVFADLHQALVWYDEGLEHVLDVLGQVGIGRRHFAGATWMLAMDGAQPGQDVPSPSRS